uniref:peptidyl-tRNA hydrolase n=2 Tax=Triatoma infestans TaxID=30076 RepID=A0A161N0Z2_TRIIF
MYTVYGILMGFTLGVVSALAGAHLLKHSRNISKQVNSGVAAARAALNIRDTKMVLVVRTELGMGKGKIAAQCSHAALGCYKIAQKNTPTVLNWWEASGQPKIVLKLDTPGEEGLYKLMQEAKKRGVVSTVIRDAGHTQVERGTATVAGIGPGEVDVLDQITGHLKLL